MTTSLGSSGGVNGFGGGIGDGVSGFGGGVGDGFAGGDGLLPMTGFGPGSILIALIGGVLTVSGAIIGRFGRRPTPVDP